MTSDAEAVEAPLEVAPAAPAKRYAIFQGMGSGFSWGQAKFIRRGDIIEVDRYDVKMLSYLSNPDQRDWREIDPELVPQLHHCEPCNTYRYPERMASHFDAVHRQLAEEPLRRLHELQTRLALLDAAKKALVTAEKQAKAEADKVMDELKAIGLPSPDYAPDHTFTIDIQYRKDGVLNKDPAAHMMFGREAVHAAAGVFPKQGQSLGAYRL